MIPSTRLLWLAAAMFPPAAVAGLFPAAVPFTVALAAVAAVLAAADLIFSARLLHDCRAGALPARLHKDRPATITVNVTAPEPATVRAAIPWPDGIGAELDEQTVTLPAALCWKLTAHRRGDFTIPSLYLSRDSRFGLWEVRAAIPLGATLSVFPNLQGKDELLAIHRHTAGDQTRRQLGRGREFEQLREYLPGDGFDEIDWKATARRAKPVTRVFRVERTQEIYAIVDASRLTARPAGAEPRLERYIQAALALGAATARQGDRFGLATFHHRLDSFVRASRGPAHTALCRQALYRLEPQLFVPDFDDIAAHLRSQLRARAFVIFLTDLDDPAAAESFARAARLLTAKHLVAAVSIHPPAAEPLFSQPAAGLDQVYDSIGAHLRWKSLKETELLLRREGIHFRLPEESVLSRQLTALYGEIKQRQVL